MKRMQQYWHQHHELLAVAITAFFLFAGALQYAIGWQYVLYLTPLVIGLIAAMTVLYWQAPATNRVVLFLVAFTVGLVSEMIGVNSGLLFGEYRYGTILGLALFGVPIIIGITWAFVTIAAWQLVSFSTFGNGAKIVLAAGVIVLFDLLLEQFATAFGLWQWAGGVIPLKNYITWLVVSGVLLSIYAKWAQQKQPSLYGAIALPMLAIFFWFMLLVR